jgi:hypothetical protein
MPAIDDRRIVLRGNSSCDAWPNRVVRSLAMISAIPLWLGACSSIGGSTPQAAATPITVERSLGPILLAPSMTGLPPVAVPLAPPLKPAPGLATPAQPAPPAPAAPPAGPAVTHAAPSPPPGLTTSVEIPTFAPVLCPPGTIAMWGESDMSGTPVAVCRRVGPPR